MGDCAYMFDLSQIHWYCFAGNCVWSQARGSAGGAFASWPYGSDASSNLAQVNVSLSSTNGSMQKGSHTRAHEDLFGLFPKNIKPFIYTQSLRTRCASHWTDSFEAEIHAGVDAIRREDMQTLMHSNTVMTTFDEDQKPRHALKNIRTQTLSTYLIVSSYYQEKPHLKKYTNRMGLVYNVHLMYIKSEKYCNNWASRRDRSWTHH